MWCDQEENVQISQNEFFIHHHLLHCPHSGHGQTFNFPTALEGKVLCDWRGQPWSLETWSRGSAYSIKTGSCCVSQEGRENNSGNHKRPDLPPMCFAIICPRCAEHPLKHLLHTCSFPQPFAQSYKRTSGWQQERKAERKDIWFTAVVFLEIIWSEKHIWIKVIVDVFF